jgi:Ca2+-binding EF-hand superfamily protein
MVLKKSDWTMSDTEIQEHFDKADKNGDGKIAFNGKYYVLIE